MDYKRTEILQVALDFGSSQIKVGRMAQKGHQVWLEYDEEFLNSGFRISPFKLPQGPGLHSANLHPFDGLYGVFNDSLPDGWGKLLLDRALLARGVAYQGLSVLDRLAFVGSRGMGALVYYPEQDLGQESRDLLDLDRLAEEIAVVQAGEAEELLEMLRELGGSSAGARPKIVVGYHPESNMLIPDRPKLPKDYAHWLVKFPSSTDQRDIAHVEHAYSEMARAAGLEIPPTKLFEGKEGRAYFGVQRFDRQGISRLHMHSVSGMLHADHRFPSLDYESVMKCAMVLNRDLSEAEKVFRLAAFNVFAHNRDDHAKNFSFLMDEKGTWRFSPVYDLTFSFGPGQEHCTTVMGEGAKPGKEHLLKLGELFGLRLRKQILEEVQEAVQAWPSFAQNAGVGARSARLVGKYMGI